MCVMSLWFFNIFIDGCMREMKAKMGKIGCRIEAEWSGVVSNCVSACK